MSETYNCDSNRVVEAIENIDEEPEVEEPIEIQVWDKDVVMRGISNEAMEERNIQRDYLDDYVCRIELHTASQIKLKFHERVVENEFSLNPAGPNAIDPRQATHPGELGEQLGVIVKQLDYAYDCIWDFASVNGASIAHGGHITDYEFTYETFMN